MAVTNHNTDLARATDQLDARCARLGGIGSAVLGLAFAAGAVVWLVMSKDLPGWAVAACVAKLVVFCALVAAGAQLVRGQTWAQRLLLAYWLIALLVAAVFAISAILWGVPAWWAKYWPWHPAWVLVPFLAVALLAVVVLVRAAAAGSRLRYASMVSVSVTAAIAVAAVVNVIAQTDYYRRAVETLGRYRVSDRTRTILRDLDRPVTVTCVYTGTDEKTRSEYRPQVMELLAEMRELQPKIDLHDVANDDDKAEVLSRLRRHLGGKAEGHHKLLEQFVRAAADLETQLQDAQKQWAEELPYLELWGEATILQDDLKKIASRLGQAGRDARRELQGGSLPRYDKLVTDAKEALREVRQVLEAHQDRLARISKVPAAVAANRQAAADAVAACEAAFGEMAAAVGKPSDADPQDPSAVLTAFVTAAEKANRLARDAAVALAEVAGKDNADLLRECAAWLIQMRLGGEVPMNVRLSLHELFSFLGQTVTQARDKAAGYQKAVKPEYQVQLVVGLRRDMAQSVAYVANAGKVVAEALQEMAAVDAASAALLEQAKGGRFFQPLLDPVAGLLDEVDKLPEIQGDSLADKISGERNFLILEVGEGAGKKVEVVGFDEVWPLKADRMVFAPEPEAERQRVFNGDGAVGSKLLQMTREPFATVLLTYVQGPPAHPMFGGGARFDKSMFTSLREQLEKANFQVKEWDLNQEMPAAGADDPPQVLLILPPPEPSMMGARPDQPPQGFGPMHENRIREAIDEGTPAIFLTSWEYPRRFGPPAEYPLAPYLRGTWGVETKADYRVIPAAPDPDEPGQFKIEPLRFNFLPLSTFTDMPIGRPLQGLRVLWNDLCPVTAADFVPKDVKVTPVLTVPATSKSTWATNQLERLIRQIEEDPNSRITPDYAGGDIAVPFDVAVAATREKTDQANACRIVVLPLAASLVNEYLDRQVPVLDSNGTWSLTDPPRSNAEVIVNSVYWLIGKDGWIARGPVWVKPVEMISEAALTALWALCVIGLPALVLAVGGGVLLIRRR